MTPVTRKEPPAKKAKQSGQQLRLAIEKLEVLDNRGKLPLHVMKEVFDYIPHEEQSNLRQVCSFWDSCISTRPSHFHPLVKFQTLFCELSNSHVYSIGNGWLDISREMKCCEHLKGLASEMVTKLFLPQQQASAQIKIAVSMPNPTGYGYNWISHAFRNKLSRTTAFPVLHLLYHLRQGAFDELHGRDTSFLRSVHPEITAVFGPMHCRRFWIDIPHPESDVPSLESFLAIAKPQEIAYQLSWDNTGRSSECVKGLLETFAIGPRQIYKSVGFFIIFWVVGGMDTNDRWTVLFKMVIEFFCERLKESREVAPRIDFSFLLFSPQWPFSPLSAMEPTRMEEQKEQERGIQVIKRTFHYKIGGEGGTKTFEAEVKCKVLSQSQVSVRRISFLFK